LTLGELQAVLDDTRGDGAAPGGIGHAWREYNLVDGVSRAELVDLVRNVPAARRRRSLTCGPVGGGRGGRN
jgi:hypothetical protein